MLIEKAAVSRRWTEYFERLLNLEEDGEPVIIPVVRERGVIVFELNDDGGGNAEVSEGDNRESCWIGWMYARMLERW